MWQIAYYGVQRIDFVKNTSVDLRFEKKRIIFSACILALFLMAGNSHAIMDPFIVYGYVNYINGSPVVGAQVNLSVPTQNLLDVTNSKGQYSVVFDDYVDGDTISIIAVKDNYTGTTKGIITKADGGMQIDFIIFDKTNVTVTTPTNLLAIGDTFTINITTNPYGREIAGMQTNINFNQAIVHVNSVTEGNLFTQNGAPTIFISGTINNTEGFVKDIYGAIIGKDNVTTVGNFITVNFTAIKNGTTYINLTNVIVAEPKTGDAAPLDITNGSVTVGTQQVITNNNIFSIAGNLTALTGENVTVPLMLYNATGAASFEVNLSYDPSVVIPVNVTNSDFDLPPGPPINPEKGYIIINAMQFATGLNGDIKLGDITLQAVGNEGDTSHLNLTDIKLDDMAMQDIPIDGVINGYFLINESNSTDLLITIQSPENNTVYTRNWVWANVTLNKTASWCGVSLNGTANKTMLNTSTTAWYLNLSVPAEGSNNVKFFCNDTEGNMENSSVVYFTAYYLPPTITFVDPTSNLINKVIKQSFIPIKISSSEPLSTAFIEWNGTQNITMGKTGPTWFKLMDFIPRGNYTFKVYGNDMYGNLGQTEEVWVYINNTLMWNMNLALKDKLGQTIPNATIRLYNETKNIIPDFKVNNTNPSKNVLIEHNKRYNIDFILPKGPALTIRNLKLTKNATISPQFVDIYTAALPSSTTARSYAVALNDTNLSYDTAQIILPISGAVNRILHCTNWNFSTAVCYNWKSNPLSDYNYTINGSNLTFNVTGFDAYLAAEYIAPTPPPDNPPKRTPSSGGGFDVPSEEENTTNETVIEPITENKSNETISDYDVLKIKHLARTKIDDVRLKLTEKDIKAKEKLDKAEDAFRNEKYSLAYNLAVEAESLLTKPIHLETADEKLPPYPTYLLIAFVIGIVGALFYRLKKMNPDFLKNIKFQKWPKYRKTQN